MAHPLVFPLKNRLLARLPAGELQRLAPFLQPCSLVLKQILYQARAPIDYVYFPSHGVVSAITIMANGSAIEVATIGNEGMVGLTAFIGNATSVHEVMVQATGDGLRMRADVLYHEARPDGPLRQALVLYNSAFTMQVSYAVACNGLHTIQKRCCRWILMTQDRIDSDVLPLTHEFLAIMLGVRRSSITEVLHPLVEAGLIRTRRGEIRVVDRPGLVAASCECYQAVHDEFERLLG